MAITQTLILNKAFTICGANPITDITDDTRNARALNSVYEIALKSVLSECKWSFATTRATLSTTSTTTMVWYHTNEAYVYDRPSAAIRIFDTNDKYAEWREEGDFIITNTASLGIAYVYYHETPSKYPPSFIEAFIDKLCSDVCFMILNSSTQATAFLEKYIKISLPKAMAENSQIGLQQTMKDDAWERAKDANGSADA